MNKFCYKCLNGFLPSEERYHGLHNACFQEWFKLPSFTDFQSLALIPQTHESQTSLATSSLGSINNSFFQGKFKKYSATLDKDDYILKVQQNEYPELPASEYLCNQIAKLLKINVPEFYFIQFQNSLYTFVVKNFMGEIKGGNLIHIYRYLKRPQDFNCQTLLHIIQEKTRRRDYVVQFINMCLFDALIGNHDRHGSNVALIETAKGFILAPVYDNPSYLAIEEDSLLAADHEPSGKIFTQTTNNPTMKDYVFEFEKLGFNNIVNHFRKSVDLKGLFSLISKSFISDNRKDAFVRLITKRHKELCHE